MDPIVFGIVAAVFTAFGYIWGRGAEPNRRQIERIVSKTMDSLVRDGYLREEVLNGEICYIKWPKNREKDL
jgi:hypothetical protein